MTVTGGHTRRKRTALVKAREIAETALGLLSPACARIEIAGSIRRGQSRVGDVELVALPRVRTEVADLFGEVQREVDELHELLAQLVGANILRLRKDARGRTAFGRRYARLELGGMQVDLFSVLPPSSWGVLYLLRTGPADFSHRLVTPRHLGGWLPMGFRVDGGALWEGGVRRDTAEEDDVFAALGLPFLEPERRTDTVRLRSAGMAYGSWRWEEAGR